MSKFEIGHYCKSGDGFGNFILHIKKRTNKNNLSFTIDYYGIYDRLNNRMYRQIQTDEDRNEYLNFILFDKDHPDINTGDGIKLEAKELLEYIYNPEDDE